MSNSNQTPKTPKPKIQYFPKNSDEIVTDYIFSDEHEDSDVSRIMQKLDRYNNGSDYTSSNGGPFDFRRLEKTLTSKLRPNGVHATDCSNSPTCKHKLFLTESPCSSTLFVAASDAEIEGILDNRTTQVEQHGLTISNTSSASSSSRNHISASTLSSSSSTSKSTSKV